MFPVTSYWEPPDGLASDAGASSSASSYFTLRKRDLNAKLAKILTRSILIGQKFHF